MHYILEEKLEINYHRKNKVKEKEKNHTLLLIHHHFLSANGSKQNQQYVKNDHEDQ